MNCKRILAALMCAMIPFGTAILSVKSPISAAASSGSMTFEELYALEENELEQYCSKYDLTYLIIFGNKSRLYLVYE